MFELINWVCSIYRLYSSCDLVSDTATQNSQLNSKEEGNQTYYLLYSFDLSVLMHPQNYVKQVISMKRLPLHKTLESLAWLEGTWRIESYGHGKFPTMDDFRYCEELNFTSIGQPMFNYTAQSWHPEEKKPLHRETGFLKLMPGTNKVSLILAHNFGLSTIEQGEVIDKTICLDSVSIQRMEGMKPPAVTQVTQALLSLLLLSM